MGTKYYFYMIGNTIGSLRRIVRKPNYLSSERWEAATGIWVDSPDTYGGVHGFSSDDNYKEVTKQEAEKYIKNPKSS